jgi:hypothetical protein
MRLTLVAPLRLPRRLSPILPSGRWGGAGWLSPSPRSAQLYSSAAAAEIIHDQPDIRESQVEKHGFRVGQDQRHCLARLDHRGEALRQSFHRAP